MTTFNRIVLSRTEPENIHDLWMRDNIVPLSNGKNELPHSKSLWWYCPEGWKKLFDFDTRYETGWIFEYESQADDPLEVTEVYDPVIGITKVTNTLHIYDATRDLENNWNLVNEIGLKWHVDDLQRKIDNLQSQVNTLKEQNATLNQSVSTLQSNYSSLASRVAALEG